MQIKIKDTRGSFLSIRQPYTPKNGDAKFTGNFIVSEDTTVTTKVGGETITGTAKDVMNKVIPALCKEKWGKVPAKLENYVFCKADGSGTRDAYTNDDGDYYDGYSEDTWYFAAGTKQRDKPNGILIVDQKRMQLPPEAGHPVSGDYVNVILNVFAYEYEGKKGVSASLEGVQYLREGEPFGAGSVSADAFDEEEVEEEAEDDDVNF